MLRVIIEYLSPTISRYNDVRVIMEHFGHSTCHYMRRACLVEAGAAVSNDFLLLLFDSRSYYFPLAVFVDCCSDEVEASLPTPDPPQLVLWRSVVVLRHICLCPAQFFAPLC